MADKEAFPINYLIKVPCCAGDTQLPGSTHRVWEDSMAPLLTLPVSSLPPSLPPSLCNRWMQQNTKTSTYQKSLIFLEPMVEVVSHFLI